MKTPFQQTQRQRLAGPWLLEIIAKATPMRKYHQSHIRDSYILYRMKGFYYNQRGNQEKAAQKNNPEAGHEPYRQAAVAYLSAAECFPQDDETHACPYYFSLFVGLD